MRTAFIQTLMECANTDERIWLLVGDLGYSVVEPFRQEFPDRFINVGVAEQNMTGVATGLALSGKVVFTYSIANFPTLRCLEQIRNDVCYHKANVKIVSVGAGLTYGAQGMTHHGTEDIAIMRALPYMTVISPADAIETKAVIKEVIRHNGPCYIRLMKSKEKPIHCKDVDFTIGKAINVLEGGDIAIISFGSMLANAINIAQKLQREESLSVKVISMPTIKPIDAECIKYQAKEVELIVSLEEHNLVGGFGSAIAEVIVDSGLKVDFIRFGLSDESWGIYGSRDYICKLHNLGEDFVQRKIIERFKK